MNAAAKYHRNRQDERYDRDRYSRRDENIHEDERYRRGDYYQPKHSDRQDNGRPLKGRESYHIVEDDKQHYSHMEGHNPKVLDDRGETHHIDEKKKREIYDNLHRKILNREDLTEKQQRAYKLLYNIYGSKRQDTLKEGSDKEAQGAHGHQAAMDLRSETKPGDAHLKKETEAHHRQQAQAPPSPANDRDNNEQEEVKDLVDGQQKLDSAKETQKDGGAGEKKPDAGAAMDKGLPKDEGEDANVEGNDPRDDPKDNMPEEEGDNQDQPLQKPVPEGGEKKPKEENGRQQQRPVIDPPEPVGNGHEDDEDVDGGDYNKRDREEGEDERNRVNVPANQPHDEGGEVLMVGGKGRR